MWEGVRTTVAKENSKRLSNISWGKAAEYDRERLGDQSSERGTKDDQKRNKEMQDECMRTKNGKQWGRRTPGQLRA